jgi:S1-C subfamily serine protease
MRQLSRSRFAAAVLGGLVVAGVFLLLGVTGRRETQTVVEQSPVDASSAGGSSGLTPHAIYVRNAPGVVYVRASVRSADQGLTDEYGERRPTVSTGSGFLIDTDGHILTNYHLIDGTSAVTVDFQDGVTRPATVAGVDQEEDLALLKVSLNGVPDVTPLELGDSSNVQVGDPTLAIGNPFGLDRTLTSGIVSALQAAVPAPSGMRIDNVIQTDAAVGLGDSGGPLLDAAGRVIGINSRIVSGGGARGPRLGIQFAIPIDTAKEMLPKLERRAPRR